MADTAGRFVAPWAGINPGLMMNGASGTMAWRNLLSQSYDPSRRAGVVRAGVVEVHDAL